MSEPRTEAGRRLLRILEDFYAHPTMDIREVVRLNIGTIEAEAVLLGGNDVSGINSYDRNAPTPAVGSTWTWESDSPAREQITVLAVEWNGEEWWVRTSGSGSSHWNDLGRFWEAVGGPAEPSDAEYVFDADEPVAAAEANTCDHTGIGQPGCRTCDPAVRPEETPE